MVRAFEIDGSEVEEVELGCRVSSATRRSSRSPARPARASTRSTSASARDCEMPLVYVGRGEQEPITEAHERARKVKPQYTGGEPVKVGFAATSPRPS